MVEKEQIYNTKLKYKGVFPYKLFYQFCYDWIMEQTEVDTFSEKEYEEKIQGNEKEVKIEWETTKKLTDYFRMDIKINFHITNMVNVEINRDGKKFKMNEAKVKVIIKGNL